MSQLKSTLDLRSAEYRANAEAMQRLVTDLEARAREISLGGDAKACDKLLMQRMLG